MRIKFQLISHQIRWNSIFFRLHGCRHRSTTLKKIEIINVGPPINVPYEGVSCDVNCSSVIYYTSSYQLIFYSITHTHPFNSSVWDYPGWAGTRKVKPIWILLKQETVSGIGISWAICKSAPRSRQTTTPAPHRSVFLQAGCPSCHPTNSVKALKAQHNSTLIMTSWRFTKKFPGWNFSFPTSLQRALKFVFNVLLYFQNSANRERHYTSLYHQVDMHKLNNSVLKCHTQQTASIPLQSCSVLNTSNYYCTCTISTSW